MDYDGSVEIHSIDLPLDEALRRNRARGDAAILDSALRNMAEKREPALTDEAHVLVSYDRDLAPRVLLAPVAKLEQAPCPV